MKNYNKFSESDNDKSKIFAVKLETSENSIKKIEEWFKTLLSEHYKAKNFEEQLIIEKKLENQFSNIYDKLDIQCLKYIFGKLLSYNNIFESGFLKSQDVPRLSYLLSDTLIPKVFKVVKSKFSSLEFNGLTEYLRKNFFVSPNGELLEYIFKLEKASNSYFKSNIQIRLEIVKNITEIINDKKFHHDIICFKKILTFITQDDKDTITFLKNFQVKNKQGCYLILNTILNSNLNKDIFADFQIKKEIVFLFDSAKGANPTEKWLLNFRQIASKISLANLEIIKRNIVKLSKQKKYNLDKHTIWTDDVASRFLKSIDWINDQT